MKATYRHRNHPPFGSYLAGSDRKTTETTYDYGFNGKRKDPEMYNVSGSSYDFGSRMYDSRLGRFISIDRFHSKHPYFSPFSSGNNMPINSIDVQGDSLSILVAVDGYDSGDGMFYNAALTRQYDIEHSPTFNPATDKVVVLQVRDISQIERKVEATVKANSNIYGETVEFGIWSHAGTDGPIGSKVASKNPLKKGSKQMNLKGWSGIDFNWSKKGARAQFYGCNTGKDPVEPKNAKKKKASFATEASALENFKNVSVWGQTSSAYPSIYTNSRKITQEQFGGDYRMFRYESDCSYPNAASDRVQIFTKTYMVGGDRYESLKSLFGGTNANPMRISKNGKGDVKDTNYQKGDKK